MVFSSDPKWMDIQEVVDGETKLDAETINKKLRAIASRTDYLKTHLEALMNALKIMYLEGDGRSQEEKDTQPMFNQSVLQLLAGLKVEGQLAPPNGLTSLPSDTIFTTDQSGAPTLKATENVVSSGGNSNPAPTEDKGVKGVIVLEEKNIRGTRTAGTSSITTSPAEFNKTFYPSGWNYMQRWGEEIISNFYYLDNNSLPQTTAPDTDGNWTRNYPLFFTLKKGNYMIDAVIDLLYARTGQARIAKQSIGLSSSTDEDFDAINKSSLYGSQAFATRLSLPIIPGEEDEFDGSNIYNAGFETAKQWGDANNSTSQIHGIITEQFFEGKEELDIGFEVFFADANYTGLKQPAPTLGQFVWAFGFNGFNEAPEDTFNIFKRLRIVKLD
ncbi:MAG: hypothetical protein AAF378_19015 [Cyanobacteria bacterium P01_A01_bin.84]